MKIKRTVVRACSICGLNYYEKRNTQADKEDEKNICSICKGKIKK